MREEFLSAAEKVICASKFIYHRRMVNAYEGNVSVRVGGRLIITPSQVCKDELRPIDLVEVDIESEQVLYAAAGRKPSSEVKMHLACYRARPDVFGVAHAHPPCATAYAVCAMPIETKAYPEMMLLHGKVPLCGYGRPGTWAVCDDIPGILAEYDSFLLANHGLVSVGKDIMDAVYRLEAVESIADMLMRARMLGGEAVLPDDEVSEIEVLSLKMRGRS